MGLARRLVPTSFRGQIVASTAGLMAVVMVCVSLVLQVLLAYTASRDIDRVLQDRADAVASVLEAGTGGDTLEVPAELIEPGVRVYDQAGAAVAGTIEQEALDAADRLGVVTSPRTVDVQDDVRLRALPFVTAGGLRGVVVVSQATDPYERSENYAFIATSVIGVLVVAATAGIAHRVTSRALAPVAQMARRATEWSEHDLSHRFDLGPGDNELAQLGATLDRLLDRVATAIRSEQRLTSELAHELRTPLTSIQGSADLALLRGVSDPQARTELEQIARSARRMSEAITTLLDAAHDPAAGAGETCLAAEVVQELAHTVPRRVRFVDETGTSSGRIAAPQELVLRALAPLVDNAVAHARTTVTVQAADQARTVTLAVVDDGPGIDEEVRDRLFQPGASGSGSTGLGLGIALRIVRSLGGRIDTRSSSSGTRFVVTLPRG
ncbi:HAMP domain-containing sensor histidine kinase [Promicromonospora sukumoe]|uniref:histidine kinase n=1 Tax=Promicromonospora sukumoe TaxID=88382 RepID=A0A7W3J7R9_9MICO|nr:HAMP domain-containing sensor histidine kinase [Promicromonospora sukumoe]MBA8807826.1 signal transduction histidine kinase [Promicromonospora sukumoe]